MVECTLSITHCLRLNLQLHTIDLVRTCRISSFCTVASQLARFQLTRRIARSLGDSSASCKNRTGHLGTECIDGEEDWGGGNSFLSRLGGLGECRSSPSGVWGEAQPKMKKIVVHFLCENPPLVNRILLNVAECCH